MHKKENLLLVSKTMSRCGTRTHSPLVVANGSMTRDRARPHPSEASLLHKYRRRWYRKIEVGGGDGSPPLRFFDNTVWYIDLEIYIHTRHPGRAQGDGLIM